MTGKKVILAVTGGIAAYKSVYLTRELVRMGCEVQVLMTPAAREFVSGTTFATLSRRPVKWNIIDGDQWNSHVELGLWADAMVIAPCTANTLAKCAHGLADNLVVATYLSARCPVFLAPAMDLDMWKHGSTADNLALLEKRGDIIIPVGTGELASGLTGEGRMAEPTVIAQALMAHFSEHSALAGKKVLVTAGPTHEHFDPVRFIGNPSTGTMGIAIAEALQAAGAMVELVLGPAGKTAPAGVSVTHVQTADEMLEASKSRFRNCDIAVLAAAVSDYRPARTEGHKIKKEEGPLTVQLERTPDIAAQLAETKKHQITVGFALETDNEEQNAYNKLVKKKFDLIVLNSLRDEGAGFGESTNKITLIYPDKSSKSFALKSKAAVAQDIVGAIIELTTKSR